MLFAIVMITFCLRKVGRVFSNTKLLFAKHPTRLITGKLPHITIQCPVDRESLTGVIDPTVQSLKAAIASYKSQGGTASIFMNDDGMQLMDQEMRAAREKYYRDNNIGWVARPPHKQDGFVRAGRFRKVQ